jgi:hypothetical protein
LTFDACAARVGLNGGVAVHGGGGGAQGIALFFAVSDRYTQSERSPSAILPLFNHRQSAHLNTCSPRLFSIHRIPLHPSSSSLGSRPFTSHSDSACHRFKDHLHTDRDRPLTIHTNPTFAVVVVLHSPFHSTPTVPLHLFLLRIIALERLLHLHPSPPTPTITITLSCSPFRPSTFSFKHGPIAS